MAPYIYNSYSGFPEQLYAKPPVVAAWNYQCIVSYVSLNSNPNGSTHYVCWWVIRIVVGDCGYRGVWVRIVVGDRSMWVRIVVGDRSVWFRIVVGDRGV